MHELLRNPVLVFVLTLVVLAASEFIGSSLVKKRGALDAGSREDLAMIAAATLTLLGLLIGFSFSMATSRYDQRKAFEEGEANAIGTEYVRADLLPAADAAVVRALLKEYLGQRVLSYSTRSRAQRAQVDSRAAELQGKLWSAVRAPAAAQPTPIMALVVSGMNDVLNSQGYAQAGLWNRIPPQAWSLMAAIAVCCNLLVGLGARPGRAKAYILVVLPLVVAVAFYLIAELDSPHSGLIRVVPQNLLSLAQSLQ
ncbi:MAG: bestrophin-like domain [Myxococcaceae bacterium]